VTNIASRLCVLAAIAVATLGSARAHESEAAPPDSSHAHRVVLVVWDGMRPDFVTPDHAPTLDKLARDGVRFQNHHSVYVTATDVNGTALATGVYPNRSGIFANSEFRPGINPRQAIDTAEPSSLAAGDAATNGKFLAAPTIAELVRGAGKKVAIAGSKSVAVLNDRQNQWAIAATTVTSLTAFAGAPISAALRDSMSKSLGPFLVSPAATGAERNTYATRALTEVLWRDGVPDFSLLWLGEPDLAQHNHAPGSSAALAAIKASDDNLATLLRVLDEKHARDTTDILVVSDHGFSTIRRSVDVAALLNDAGFHAAKQFSATPKPGDILVVGNGGTVVFYVQDHDHAVSERLVDWLQHRDFTGTIFARDKIEGTFPLAAIRIDTADAADILMSFRWSPDKNEFGVAGLIDADWNRPAGQGTHATLSPFDVHNTLVAAGPDFRRGFEDTLPTGNIDIAPTVLHLLGITTPARFDGRVVTEALPNTGPPAAGVKQQTLTAQRKFEDGGKWQQSLKTLRVGETIYFDNGSNSRN
jgi:predicted AlkP superfamily pyrophosphatase or phosphodiesterase